MSDSSTGEKTEEPTSKKLRDAKNKGDVAKSKDVASTAVYIGLMLLFIASGHTVVFGLIEVFQQSLIEVSLTASDQIHQNSINKGYIKKTILIVSPAIAVAILFGVAANYAQVGFIFSTESLKMDVKKLNPVTNLIGMFKKPKLVNHGLTIFKTTIILTIVFIIIWPMLFELQFAMYLKFDAILTMLYMMLIKLCSAVALIYVIFSAFDWFVQKALYIEKLKMSKYDVKKEYISSEGHPEIKGQRKAIHREISNS